MPLVISEAKLAIELCGALDGNKKTTAKATECVHAMLSQSGKLRALADKIESFQNGSKFWEDSPRYRSLWNRKDIDMLMYIFVEASNCGDSGGSRMITYLNRVIFKDAKKRPHHYAGLFTGFKLKDLDFNTKWLEPSAEEYAWADTVLKSPAQSTALIIYPPQFPVAPLPSTSFAPQSPLLVQSAADSSVTSNMRQQSKRKIYKCGICGQPKRGHNCSGKKSMIAERLVDDSDEEEEKQPVADDEDDEEEIQSVADVHDDKLRAQYRSASDFATQPPLSVQQPNPVAQTPLAEQTEKEQTDIVVTAKKHKDDEEDEEENRSVDDSDDDSDNDDAGKEEVRATSDKRKLSDRFKELNELYDIGYLNKRDYTKQKKKLMKLI